jgi:hypothetical protein
MAMRIATAAAVCALAVGGAANAQTRFEDREIVGAIVKCLSENAPENWRAIIFRLDQVPAAAGGQPSVVVEHKVVVGPEGSPPQDVKPCRPDYAQNAAETFRENQDEKARRWTGVTINFERNEANPDLGRYSLTYRYPK